MAILIKGAKMPESCAECHFQKGPVFGVTNDENGDYFCSAPNGEAHGRFCSAYCYPDSDDRPDFCPLVEVPEGHERLIDADSMIWYLTHWVDKNGFGHENNQEVFTLSDIVDAIQKSVEERAEGGEDE